MVFVAVKLHCDVVQVAVYVVAVVGFTVIDEAVAPVLHTTEPEQLFAVSTTEPPLHTVSFGAEIMNGMIRTLGTLNTFDEPLTPQPFEHVAE
jgi:hypothetical protein